MVKRRKNKFDELSDLELIRNFTINGDKKCFREMFERYQHLIFLSCLKYLKNEEDSKDASYEIFEKLLDDCKKYDITNFKAWLYQVVRNYCLKKLELKSRFKIADVDVENVANLYVENSDFLSLNKEKRSEMKSRALHEALDSLNEEQKACLQLFYFQKKSYKEISAITGFSISNVKSHLQNGKRNLKKIMQLK